MYSLPYAFFCVLFAGCWSWIHTRVACCAPSIVHKTFLYLDLKILILKLLCIQDDFLSSSTSSIQHRAHTHKSNPRNNHHRTTFSILNSQSCLSVYLSIGGDEDEPRCGFLALWNSPHQNQGQGHACQDRVRTRTKQSVSLTDWNFFRLRVVTCRVGFFSGWWYVFQYEFGDAGVGGVNQWDIGILE